MKYYILLSFLVFMALSGCRNTKWKLVGWYKINLEKSDFNCLDKDKMRFKDLVIEFRENDSFYLNMDIPFLANDTGNYRLMLNAEDGVRFTDLKYKNDNEDITDRLIDNLSNKDDDIVISNPVSKPSRCGVNVICFEKLKPGRP